MEKKTNKNNKKRENKKGKKTKRTKVTKRKGSLNKKNKKKNKRGEKKMNKRNNPQPHYRSRTTQKTQYWDQVTTVRLTLIHARFGLKIIVPPVYILDQIGSCKTLFQMDFNTESDVVVYLIHRFITLFFLLWSLKQ